MNAAYFGRGDDRDIRLFGREESGHRSLIGQIKLRASSEQQINRRLTLETAH